MIKGELMNDKLLKTIGKPVESDRNAFIKTARMLQGWYRAFVLGLEQGCGPNVNDKIQHCYDLEQKIDSCISCMLMFLYNDRIKLDDSVNEKKYRKFTNATIAVS